VKQTKRTGDIVNKTQIYVWGNLIIN
jgi:hypothetical protein